MIQLFAKVQGSALELLTISVPIIGKQIILLMFVLVCSMRISETKFYNLRSKITITTYLIILIVLAVVLVFEL